jgi:anti-sigma B factor antagonist
MPGDDRERGAKRGASCAELTIRRVIDGRHHLVELVGELDLAASDALRGELDAAADADAELTVIDLRRLRFADSTGLSVLFEAAERANGEGRRIVFTRSSPEVERTLRLTGLDQILTFDASPPLENLPREA